MKFFVRRFNPFSIYSLLIVLSIVSTSCNRRDKAAKIRREEEEQKKAAAARAKKLIENIKGIHYTEVKRTFDNGLSFSPVGYQLVPEWRISFPSSDSVNIYSPKKKKFMNTPVVFDHDSIYNVAWAWLKLRYIKKDSIQFMVLHVHDNIIQDEKTHVFMTFYTNDYIKNTLHGDTLNLWKPSRKDTDYIKAKTAIAAKNIDSSFAGTTPVVLKSKNPLVTVKKEITPIDDVNGGMTYDDYLSPTYDVTVHGAYKDFYYSYVAFVNVKGEIIFWKSLVATMPEFKKATDETIKAITQGYLMRYLTVTPGSTLEITHNSLIFLNVTGSKK